MLRRIGFVQRSGRRRRSGKIPPCPGEVACRFNPDRATRRRAGSARRHPRQSGRVALPKGAWALQPGRDDRATLRSTDKESEHEKPQSARRQAGTTPNRARRISTPKTTFGARNYDPLPVVVSHGEGAWLWDIHGRRFLDMMSAYSAVSHGHAHPRIVTALVAQAQQLAVTSRAFHNDKLPLFLKRLTEVTGLARALPANGGAEAVETALKAVRKWGYKVKRIPDGQAEVIVCAGQLPRPLDHDRRVLVGTAIPRRLRAVRAGIQGDPVRRSGGARGGDHAEYGGLPGRARAGRGGDDRAAGRLSRRVRAHLPQAPRAADLRRDPDRHGTHRQVSRLRARRRRARRRDPGQGAGRRRSSGVGVRRDRGRDAGVLAGRPRQHVRRQSARRRGRARGDRGPVRRQADRALGRARRAICSRS